MTSPAELGNWMTVRDVALRLKVSPMSVYRFIRSGDLTAADLGTEGDKSRYRVSEASVIAFLDGARVTKEAS